MYSKDIIPLSYKKGVITFSLYMEKNEIQHPCDLLKFI